jgi:hypothetical protein
MATTPNPPSEETRDADRRDAVAQHDPDRAPTPDEERRADDLELEPDVAAHEREMAERGARQQGEGRIS